VEAVPLRDITAERIARALYENWITRYGIPLRVTSDRGSQFISGLFKELNRLLGAEHLKTTAYHPISDGKVERFHRILKSALMCFGRHWTAHLPSVLYGIRATPCDDSGISRAEATFGKPLKLPGEFFETTPIVNMTSYVTELKKSLQSIKPIERNRNFTNNKIFVPKDLFTCSRVFVRVDKVKLPLTAPYEGPFLVIKRNPKWFILDVNGEKKSVSIDRLKPMYDLAEEEEKSQKADEFRAQPPKSILKETKSR
jgi:hypothetical protein